MLSREDNERITRVGPGTPAGALLRSYWQPMALTTELPEPDGAPIRVRLLGEDLVAFRDSEGKVGLVDAFCSHRRAPLFFGRNEECGIRCVYHGWKFDREGRCVDLPTDPDNPKMQERVGITAYPTYEKAGVVWAYLGAPERQPAPPDYEWMRAPETHRHVSKTFEACNYLQAMEGGLDTAHSSYIHNNAINDPTRLRSLDKAPHLDVHVNDHGYTYVSVRKIGGEQDYVRVYQYVMPVQQMRPGLFRGPGGQRSNVPQFDGHIWVPIDDHHTFTWNWMCGYEEDAPLSRDYVAQRESQSGRGDDDLIPGTFRLKRNLENDYLIDRQLQKTSTFTGITGVNTQDYAVQEGMGPIVDRSKENLGQTDKAIAVMRRLMLDAIRDVEEGRAPRGVTPLAHRNARPYDGFVPAGGDWRNAFADVRDARW